MSEFNAGKVETIVNELKQKSELLFGVEIDKIENKSAQRRARKLTLEMEKLFKEFRKNSIKS